MQAQVRSQVQDTVDEAGQQAARRHEVQDVELQVRAGSVDGVGA